MTTTSPTPVSPTPGPGADPAIADPPAVFAARAVPLALAGWLLGGWVGLAAAALGALSTYRRPVTIVAAAAPVMLVGAALATVIEEPVDGDALRSSFATDRPTAATLGLLAALFALVAVVTLGVRDRARTARATAPVPGPVEEGTAGDQAADEGLTGWWARARTEAVALAPLAGVVVAAGLALALLAPLPPAATRDVAANVRNGLGWGVTTADGLAVDASEPPLAVVVAAVAPGGARAWTALAGAATVGAVAALVARRRDRRTVLLAAGAVALGLLVVRADLAATLAALATAGALLAGDPDGRTPAAAARAGAAYGLAVLAVPVLALALPVVVAALVVDVRTRDVHVSHGLAALATALVVIFPWLRWAHDQTGSWSPAADLTWPVAPLAAVALTVAAAVVASREHA